MDNYILDKYEILTEDDQCIIVNSNNDLFYVNGHVTWEKNVVTYNDSNLIISCYDYIDVLSGNVILNRKIVRDLNTGNLISDSYSNVISISKILNIKNNSSIILYKDDIITLMNYEDNSIKEEHRRRKYF